MVVLCNAKLNISLDVTGIRDDGYHCMDMVMQSVDFFDTLQIETDDSNEIKIRSNLPYLPTDGRNLVFRAAKLLAGRYSVKNRGLSVFLKKRIPSQAGLGGGSADAAGTLLALRRLWNLPADDGELQKIGLSLGADIPFCLLGGTARVEGIGEQIQPLSPLRGVWFVIAMPKRGVSTKSAFRLIDEKTGYRRPDTDALVAAMARQDIWAAAKEMKNVFETAGTSESAAPLMQKIRECGALSASMSGTGAAVFGVFLDRAAAEHCKESLKWQARAWVARPVGHGIAMKSLKPGTNSCNME